MGSVRVTLCAGAAVLAAAFAASAPSAHATDPGDISVDSSGNVSGNPLGNSSGSLSGGVSLVPVSPVTGSDIHLRVQGCGGKTGTAVSPAFVSDARLTQLTGWSLGTLAGETRVRSQLEPGTYGVRVTCDGREDKVTGTIKVGDVKPPTAQPPGPERPASPGPPAARQPSSPSSPVAPVRAGGGGAAAQLAAAEPPPPADARGSADPANSTDDARRTGPGARQTAVGLVLAGVAAVAVVARGARRGRDRRTERE